MTLSSVCSVCGTSNSQQAIFCVKCGHQLHTVLANSFFRTPSGYLVPHILLHQRYKIVAILGKGGMGTVYKAEDTLLGHRAVAIKEMSQEGLSPQELVYATEAFKHEAHILANLQNEHLPIIYDFFLEQKRCYLVMSFIAGETLAQYLYRLQTVCLPIKEVLTIGLQLCSVLEYLHEQQPPVVFRDLKPSNIMRTTLGHLYLIDFGIARHFKMGQSKDTMVFGSKGYASPEQYGHTQTSPQSDIYSLGVVLYELLTGDHPSNNPTPFQFAPLNRPGMTYPIELETLIQQMLEIQPAKRPATISIVEHALHNIQQIYFLAAGPTVTSAEATLPPVGKVLLTIKHHSDQVTALAWSPTSNSIASASMDTTVCIWDADSGGALLTYKGHTQELTSLTWSPSGQYIASGGFDRIIRIWDVTNAQEVQSYQGHNMLWSGGDAIRAIAWAPDGTRIASVSGDSTVQIWNPATGTVLFTYYDHGDQFPVRCVSWSPDGTLIASSAQYCNVWDAATGRTICSHRSGQTHAVAWAPDSKRIAISISNTQLQQGAQVKVCNAIDGSLLLTYAGHTRSAYALAWSHDGAAIASADSDVHVWNALTGAIIYTYRGHYALVSALAWSSDDARIASAGDSAVQLWQIATQNSMLVRPVQR